MLEFICLDSMEPTQRGNDVVIKVSTLELQCVDSLDSSSVCRSTICTNKYIVFGFRILFNRVSGFCRPALRVGTNLGITSLAVAEEMQTL